MIERLLQLPSRLLADVDPGKVNIPKTAADNNLVAHIFQIVFPIIGGLALLMIAVAGFRYTISGGDPGAVQKAKNQIIYSLVGLIIAIAGFAIVSFTLNRVAG